MKHLFLPLLFAVNCYSAEDGAAAAEGDAWSTLSKQEKLDQLFASFKKYTDPDYDVYKKMRIVEDTLFKHLDLEGCARTSILCSKKEKFSKEGIQLCMQYSDSACCEFSFLTPWGMWIWAKASVLFVLSHGDTFVRTSEFAGFGIVDIGESPDYLEGVQEQDRKERNKKWWAMTERYEEGRAELLGLPSRIRFNEI